MQAGDPRRRPVGQEVAQRDERRKDRRSQRQRGQLDRPQVPDDRRVDQQVERLCGQRSERREGQPEDLAVVPGTEPCQPSEGRIRALYDPEDRSETMTSVDLTNVADVAAEPGTLPERMTAWVIRQEREGEPTDAFQLEEIEVPE